MGQEAKTKFKKTPIGEIPEDWNFIKLRDVAKIRGNKRVKEVTEVAVIPMELIPDSGIFADYRVVPIEQVKSSTYCEAGDILLAKITPSLENGKQGIVPFDIPNGFALATTEVFPIAPEEDKIDRFFLFYLLKFNKFRQKIIASMTGTTGRQRASKKAVENLLIPLPPLPEQKKIAEILRTVDEAIEKTDLAIERTERLKRGLMRELLTKGIGHKEFKKTELGRIPKEWKVVRLGEILKIRKRKSVRDVSEVAVIPMEYIPQDRKLFADFEVVPIDEVKSSTYCEAGDLLLAKITPSFENGKQGIVPFDIPNGFALATTEVYPLVPSEKIDVFFLFYLLKDKRFRRVLEVRMIGTTGRQRIQKSDLLKLQIPLPPLPEQKKIAEILSTVDRRLELLRKRRGKLERVKHGLMKDLLTGRKRTFTTTKKYK